MTLHRKKINSNTVGWVYLTDHTTNRPGWSEPAFLAWVGTLAIC